MGKHSFATGSEPKREIVSGIAVDIFGMEENRGSPVVFVTHGRGGSVSDTHSFCGKLSASGFIAVGVEQRNHGERLADDRANGYSPSHAADMYGIVVGTAMDISLLIDFLPARLGMDTARCGVTGVSLGGHASLVAMGIDPRISACAALIGSGEYKALMRSRWRTEEFSAMPFEEFFPPG